jgi:hypothetical protein
VLAGALLVDRTPALSRDERIFAILAGGLGIDVPLGGGVGKTEGVKLTGSALMTFATVSLWGRDSLRKLWQERRLR